MDLPDPPEPWVLKGLNELNGGLAAEESWTAYLLGQKRYVYGYGSSARFAILDAIQRIEEDKTFSFMSGMKPLDLIKELDIKPIRRFTEGRRF